MTLLEHYLTAVRMYLPKGPQQDDIIRELSEHLQSTMEEREEAVGRRLSEVEQVELLTRHGNPSVVASRYGATNRNVAFGRQLIGPELFPLYALVLGLNWAFTIAALVALEPFVKVLTLSGLLLRMLAQLVLVTLIFACIEIFQRRSRRGNALLHNWRFPPAYLQPIPRWQSISGLIALSTVGAWWASARAVPALILGRAATVVTFGPSWHWLYWPVLALLLVGASQRAATFLRPDWNWLQAVTRFATNGLAVALLYPFIRLYPYVLALPTAPDAAAAERVARAVNGTIWWTTVAGFSLYWLINAGFNAWLCVQCLRYVMRRRSEVVR